jgi:hypothetical protein
MNTTARPAGTTRGSLLGQIALVATVLSFAGMVIQLVGSAMEADGFTDDITSQSALADIAWLIFSVGGLVALGTGIAAWARGHTSRSMFDVRAGQAAVAYFAIALLLVLLTG